MGKAIFFNRFLSLSWAVLLAAVCGSVRADVHPSTGPVAAAPGTDFIGLTIPNFEQGIIQGGWGPLLSQYFKDNGLEKVLTQNCLYPATSSDTELGLELTGAPCLKNHPSGPNRPATFYIIDPPYSLKTYEGVSFHPFAITYENNPKVVAGFYLKPFGSSAAVAGTNGFWHEQRYSLNTYAKGRRHEVGVARVLFIPSTTGGLLSSLREKLPGVRLILLDGLCTARFKTQCRLEVGDDGAIRSFTMLPDAIPSVIDSKFEIEADGDQLSVHWPEYGLGGFSEGEATAAVGELVRALDKNAPLRACFASEFHQFPFGAHLCESGTQTELLKTAHSLMERYPALRAPVRDASLPR